MKPAGIALIGILAAGISQAANASSADPIKLEAITVSASLLEQPLFDAAASVDRVEGQWLRLGTMQASISERLEHIPGLLVRDRQNLAQDTQLSIRGFGARSTFGVRGLRIYVDGIPATMPDGQGQLSNIDLASVDHIQILRGPFSVLHGNSSGGVVQVFTEQGELPPFITADAAKGSDGQWRYGLKAEGATGEGIGALDYLVSTQRYQTDGFRNHSAARKSLANARLGLQTSEHDRLTLILNHVDIKAQDPQGLTWDEAQTNPKLAAPNALAYDTRKAVRQSQAGLSYDLSLDADNDLKLTAYYGQRKMLQFLGIPMAAQTAPTHAGGVVDLERDYGGVDLRWTSRTQLAQRPLTVITGLAYDTLTEHRRGYQNFSGTQLGVQGVLRRNETNTLRNVDPYLQLSWDFAEDWTAELGARYSDIHFRSRDHYVVPGNIDDSGSLRFSRLLPVAAIRHAVHPNLNLYATAGSGYETPTFNELSYRPDAGPGLNTALAPALNLSLEVGAKVQMEKSILTAALFQTRTRDEIVTASSSGGRSSYRNAGRTLRRGLELSWSGTWHEHGQWMLSYAWLDAKFDETVATSGTGSDAIIAGKRLPGVAQHAAFASFDWAPPTGWQAGAQGRYLSRVYVNDDNSASAAGYFVASMHLGHVWQLDAWRLGTFARIDNLFDRRFIGSTIVNAGQGRYYEPAPGRNWSAGVSLTHEF